MSRLDDLRKEIDVLLDEIRIEKAALDILKEALLIPDNTERLKEMSDKIWVLFWDQKRHCEHLDNLLGYKQEELFILLPIDCDELEFEEVCQ